MHLLKTQCTAETIRNLEANTQYYFTVSVNDKAGNEAISDKESFTTDEITTKIENFGSIETSIYATNGEILVKYDKRFNYLYIYFRWKADEYDKSSEWVEPYTYNFTISYRTCRSKTNKTDHSIKNSTNEKCVFGQ